jgi:hypothetical protein
MSAILETVLCSSSGWVDGLKCHLCYSGLEIDILSDFTLWKELLHVAGILAKPWHRRKFL